MEDVLYSLTARTTEDLIKIILVIAFFSPLIVAGIRLFFSFILAVETAIRFIIEITFYIFDIFFEQGIRLLRAISDSLFINTGDELSAGEVQPINPSDSKQPQPVASLLRHLLPAADRDNMIGDLEEQYLKWVEQYGKIKAYFLYLKDACTMVYPIGLKLLVKIFKIWRIQR